MKFRVPHPLWIFTAAVVLGVVTVGLRVGVPACRRISSGLCRLAASKRLQTWCLPRRQVVLLSHDFLLKPASHLHVEISPDKIVAMSEERQHPGILLDMASIIAVPVVYALSIGPVAGILSRADSDGPEWVTGAAYVYLLPAQFVYDNSPEPVKKVVEVYVDFFD